MHELWHISGGSRRIQAAAFSLSSRPLRYYEIDSNLDMKGVGWIANQLPVRVGLQHRLASHTSDTNIGADEMTGPDDSHTETSSFVTATDASGATTTREGVFSDIADFLESKNVDVLSKSSYKAAYDARLEPGCIIYINDEVEPASRVDRRVMLMVKECFSSSYLCVSFCRHEPLPRSPRELVVHRKVYKLGSHWVEPDPTSMQAIGIELNGDDAGLREGITINLEEIYNLKPEVKVAVIGCVRPQDWHNVRQQINHLFDQDKIDGHASATAPIEPAPATAEMNNGLNPVQEIGEAPAARTSNKGTTSSRKHSKDEPAASVARQRSTRLEPDSRKKRR